MKDTAAKLLEYIREPIEFLNTTSDTMDYLEHSLTSKEMILGVLHIDENQLNQLKLLYAAGFATKKMQDSVLFSKDYLIHIEKLVEWGADYKKIKRAFLKDAKL